MLIQIFKELKKFFAIFVDNGKATKNLALENSFQHAHMIILRNPVIFENNLINFKNLNEYGTYIRMHV